MITLRGVPSPSRDPDFRRRPLPFRQLAPLLLFCDRAFFYRDSGTVRKKKRHVRPRAAETAPCSLPADILIFE